MQSFMKAAGLGPPKTDEEVAAERAAAEFAAANRSAAAKAAFKRVAAEKAAAERVAAERASKALRTALAALEFGQLAGSAGERELLRASIERARASGVEGAKVAKAEGQLRLSAVKAEAALAAERAAREAAE